MLHRDGLFWALTPPTPGSVVSMSTGSVVDVVEVCTLSLGTVDDEVDEAGEDTFEM